MRSKSGLLWMLVLFSLPLSAQRELVLKQIDLPHPYYYREMYLPQLTTGPSAAAWSPDSRALVYSMAGSLWKQNLNSTVAEQLTAGPGYDYQPDCSPDGRWVVYVSYDKDALELWALNLETRQSRPLTSGGAVNVEPRFSPDGKRIVFVSTSYQGHFHIFLADFHDGELTNVERLTGENRSPLARYYYSQFDHEISPAWSPDGSELVLVSNRGHIYGSGGFWRMKAVPGAEMREIHYEETTWKARPEFSPDGKRIVYASYLGREWNQLWMMPSEGGDAFPLSYGDFDNINPRWSPDGAKIAFISNRAGNTSLWIQEIPGGAETQLVAKQRHYLKSMVRLSITVLDAGGQPTAARVSVVGEDGRAYAPDDAWMHADDQFVRSERSFEVHYFHTPGKSLVEAPEGRITVEAMKGLEYRLAKHSLQLAAGETAKVTIRLEPLPLPQDTHWHWVGADVHVHMNYGGAYRNTPAHLIFQAAAENLAIVENLIVNKEQRIPDIAYFSAKPDSIANAPPLVFEGQEFHTSYWGHLGLLNLTRNLLIPAYAAYPGTAAASLFPANAQVADMAHAQHGLVGYAHPFESVPDPAKDPSLTDELPVDVALGKVDYIEVVGFSEHKSTAEVWYKLLNLGFHLPAAGGTDAMANFASLRGPVGLNRVYAKVPVGRLDISSWLDSLKQGHTFATDGPLLGLAVGGKEAGEELRLPGGNNQVPFKAWLRSMVPLDHLQIMCNGAVAAELKLNADRQGSDPQGTIPITHSGWCLLRTWADKPEHPVLDLYPYATTSPIYVKVGDSSQKSPEDAAYFMAWIDRVVNAVASNQEWNTEAEKASILHLCEQARAVYARLAR
jgi:TolB protein